MIGYEEIKHNIDLLKRDEEMLALKKAALTILSSNALINLEARTSIVELEGIPLFIKLLNHPNAELKNSAVDILHTLARYNAEHCSAIITMGAIPILETLSTHENAELQKNAKSTLEYLRMPPESRPISATLSEMRESLDQTMAKHAVTKAKTEEMFRSMDHSISEINKSIATNKELRKETEAVADQYIALAEQARLQDDSFRSNVKKLFEQLNEKDAVMREKIKESWEDMKKTAAKDAEVFKAHKERFEKNKVLFDSTVEKLGQAIIKIIKPIDYVKSEKIEDKIRPFIDEAGFPSYLKNPEDLSDGCFVKVPLEPGELIIEPPRELAEGWTLTEEKEDKIYEYFNGRSLTSSSNFDFNTELSFTPPVTSPITVNTGVSASSAGEKYRFQSRVEINRKTKSVFYTPPADIKDKWNALDPNSSIRNFSHYMSAAVRGARLSIIITFEFDSKESARKAQAKFAGLPNITAIIDMSQKMKTEKSVFDVRHEQVGFVPTALPEYKKETVDIMTYYADVSKWVREAKVEDPAVLSIHVKPLSSLRIQELLDIAKIKDYFYQTVMTRRVISIAQQSGLLSGPPIPAQRNSMIEEMSKADIIIPNEDRIFFQNDHGHFLNLEGDKMIFQPTENCVLKLIPADGADVLVNNTGLFSIQVFQGEVSKGYLTVENVSLTKTHYRLRCHNTKAVGKEDLYLFQLQDARVPSAGAGTSTLAFSIKSVTAASDHKYFLISPMQSLSASKSKVRFLTNGDVKGCLFVPDISLAVKCSITFAGPSYLKSLLTSVSEPALLATTSINPTVSTPFARDAGIASTSAVLPSPLAGAGVVSASATLESETLSRG